MLISEIVILCLKRKVLYEFPPKCFKTTERHSLTVLGSLFYYYYYYFFFITFTVLIKNNCLNKTKFSSGFAVFKHGKKNILSEYSVLVSQLVTFWSKKNISI